MQPAVSVHPPDQDPRLRFEREVLRGVTRALANPKTLAVIMELNSPAARQHLERRGFTCRGYVKRSVSRSNQTLANGIFCLPNILQHGSSRGYGATVYSAGKDHLGGHTCMRRARIEVFGVLYRCLH